MTTASVSFGLNHASRISRLIGQFLDGFVSVAPMFGAYIVGVITGFEGITGILLLAAALWSVGYILFADGMRGGQSLGKRWMGMVVIDAKSGEPCSYGKSFLRNLTLVLLGPLDWIFIFGDSRRRLGDRLAGTVVVSVA